MTLNNLNELGATANAKSLAYNNFEAILPQEFKTKFSELLLENSSDRIVFQKYTATVTTSKDLKIIFPNQWFYLASFFFDFLNSIWYYKNVVNEFQISSETIKQLRGSEIPDDLNILIEAKFEEIEDRVSFKKFLTDYNWWYGSKTIDRGDFFVSPVLKQANVINETSSYIASIAYYLSLSEDLYNLLTVTNDTVQSKDKSNIIYFGAPGTGKSHKVEEKLKTVDSHFFERITFHPEFDNASFVGGYKPITENVDGKDEIKYKFIPQAFTNIYERAWNDLDNQYYLAIEEINRGNCAEIFGDIFQLLDRNSNYSVSPSSELKEYLNKVIINKDGISNGLKLPPNLSILATMNTSDQSLFPMDSAFKRRWDWEYIPICYDDITENESFGYYVYIEDTTFFKWIDFIKNVNAVIKTNPNLGMDKCIGNYFIKSDSKEITLKEFVNKAIFYLWNDVFKDEDSSDSIFEKGTSYEDFFPIETNGKEEVKKILNALEIKTIVKATI